jgi:hypothetical protein
MKKEKEINELSIVVKGWSNTGKSTIIYLINEYLKENGWDVGITQTVVKDYGDEEKYLDKLGKTINKRINALQSKTKISIIEESYNRKSSIDYRDRTYLEKRKTLRQLSIKDEIKNFIDIVTDDIWDSIKGFYSHPKYDPIRKIVDVEDISFYHTIKVLLIDGYLAYEVIYDDKQKNIIDISSLDPITMIVKPAENENTWIQHPDNDNLRRFLKDSQILYFSYTDGGEYYHTSYVEELKESYEKFKMAESAHLYDTVTSQKKNIELDSVKWLEKNMNRMSRIPEDKLDIGMFQHYVDNIKYDKFIKRISDIFRINMFNRLLELNEKIKN